MTTDKDKALAALSRARGSAQRGSEARATSPKPEGSTQESASKQTSLQVNSAKDDPLKPFSSYLPVSLQKRLKLFALRNDTMVTALLEQAIKNLID